MPIVSLVSKLILHRSRADYRLYYFLQTEAGRRMCHESFDDAYAAIYRWRVLSFQANGLLHGEPTIKRTEAYDAG
jgi:hypothetical protein